MLSLWDVLYGAAAPVVVPLLLGGRLLRRRRFPQPLARLTGATAPDLWSSLPPPAGPVIWFHGVSVGEVTLLGRLIAALRALTTCCVPIVSTTTDTGLQTARRTLPAVTSFLFPLDFSWAMRRTLGRLRPDVVVLAEAELWPNLLQQCRWAGVPVALVNARMSDRSFRRYRAAGPLARRLLGQLALIAAQSDEFARRFVALGAPPQRVKVTGSIKFDGLESDRFNPRTQALRRLLRIADDELVWVAGSTSAPEEQIVLDVYRCLDLSERRVRLVLVPRHPERFDAVVELVHGVGLGCVRLSELRARRTEPNPKAVVVVDTLGELGDVWGLADVGFVGGSFARRGGQSMLEPAAYGVPTAYGPNVWNYREPAQALVQAGAARQVNSADELRDAVHDWLQRPEIRRRMGQAAKRFVARQQGAAARTARLLLELCGTCGSSTALRRSA